MRARERGRGLIMVGGRAGGGGARERERIANAGRG